MCLFYGGELRDFNIFNVRLLQIMLNRRGNEIIDMIKDNNLKKY